MPRTSHKDKTGFKKGDFVLVLNRAGDIVLRGTYAGLDPLEDDRCLIRHTERWGHNPISCHQDSIHKADQDE